MEETRRFLRYPVTLVAGVNEEARKEDVVDGQGVIGSALATAETIRYWKDTELTV